MKVEGRNAVSELLKTDKTIDRLIVAKGLGPGADKLINAARSKGCLLYTSDAADD